MNWKENKALIVLIITVVTATAGAMIYFTPQTYAGFTRQMIQSHKTEEKLMYVEKRLWELDKLCMNLKTREWLCDDERADERNELLISRKILMKELGIEE